MGSDDNRDTIFLLHLGDHYLFKYYFPNEVFQMLKEYYNQSKYRFEVPQRDLPDVVTILGEHDYHPSVVDNTDDFTVIKRKFTDQRIIKKNSVFKTDRGDYNVFVMKDRASVEKAINLGAQPIGDSDLAL